MGKVKVGVIGIGNMGSNHVLDLSKGGVEGAVLTAICDVNESRLEWAKGRLADSVQYFADEDAFFADADIDAVIVATPHYHHTVAAIKGFKKGLHVLIEKPAGAQTEAVYAMNEAAKESGKVFGIMYNQRTNPLYQKLRELIQSGELGEIKRTNWIITNWYRSQSYYDSGGWRATWEGEGGGVLINQAPHQIDLWQWTTGLMPKKVHGFCQFGKYRDIEVEDDVTAYVEYENGATGVFITSVGEAPGTNRFEIVGDRGKIVVENNRILFTRLRQSERDFNASFTGGFGEPEAWEINIPFSKNNPGHIGITKNWIQAIANGTPLLAPGEEGVNGLEISNAIHLSTWLGKPVELPVDQAQFNEQLQERIANSTINKQAVTSKTLSVEGTH